MHNYPIVKMNDFSASQITAIRELEQLCKHYDRSSLREGIESLKEEHGDHAFLCHSDKQLIGFISWYTSDGIEANLNGMVHPDYRRQGVFRHLLEKAAAEMHVKGIQTCRFRIPSNRVWPCK
ncbi:hypothetical protein SD71_20610 [Cohnella kolymensis]|uniref:N-acetyltransferase domain-containing protein n=1 Tax=Cohnella kolymensis TaxID=1590652 RepID=A0ABR5A153_9BACL|nr:hypothetical protein SD71_20610 [Cohnella kolymensis]